MIYDAFLSHAGEEKKEFVDCLNTILKHAGSNLNIFMDERSLQPGDDGWDVIELAARTSRVGKQTQSNHTYKFGFGDEE
jgi:hypothetical protein